MSLPRIVAALADLRNALASAGANQPFEIVVAAEDEPALRAFFAKWPIRKKVPEDVISEQAGVLIRAAR
jgi:hypothetical protein